MCGEFTGHRWIPLTKARDAELWCFLWFALMKRLSKQSWGCWCETPACSLRRHCNGFQSTWYQLIITYLIPNFNGPAAEVWERISNLSPPFTGIWLLNHTGIIRTGIKVNPYQWKGHQASKLGNNLAFLLSKKRLPWPSSSHFYRKSPEQIDIELIADEMDNE